MKRLAILAALAACACEREAQKENKGPVPAAAEEVLTTQGPVSKLPAVIPTPKDQAQLDRMILAGYTPHGSHLHPPGVKECPLSQGSEAVM